MPHIPYPMSLTFQPVRPKRRYFMKPSRMKRGHYSGGRESRQLKVEREPPEFAAYPVALALPVNALCTRESGTDARRALLPRRHPWTSLPRRIVPHVLRVAALEVGDPIADVVLMKSDDLAAWPLRYRDPTRSCVFTQF